MCFVIISTLSLYKVNESPLDRITNIHHKMPYIFCYKVYREIVNRLFIEFLKQNCSTEWVTDRSRKINNFIKYFFVNRFAHSVFYKKKLKLNEPPIDLQEKPIFLNHFFYYKMILKNEFIYIKILLQDTTYMLKC